MCKALIFKNVAVAFAALLLSFVSTYAHATTYVVTKTTDTVDGVCDADCSLREAINAANANVGVADIISIPAGLYAISGAANDDANVSGDFDLTDAAGITIRGDNAATTIIDGGSLDRLFHAMTGTLTIENLTVQNGQVTGVNGANAPISSSTGNNGGDGSSGLGGGIKGVTINIITSRIINNTVMGGTGGFGLGILLVGGHGGVGGSGLGGGVHGLGNIVISHSTFSGNIANGNRGGPGTYSTGKSGDGIGAGVFGSATVIINNSTFSANTAIGRDGLDIDGADGAAGGHASGGGVRSTGAVTINNSTFSANVASGGKGAFVSGGVGGGGGSGSGGGVYGLSSLSLSNATFSANTASGGNGGNSNTGWGGGSGHGRGGGVYAQTLTALNSTIANNLTTAGLVGTGARGSLAMGSSAGSGIYMNVGSASIGHSILSGNQQGGNCAPVGLFISTGYNIDDANSCGFAALGDKINSNPLLGLLSDNSGGTHTHALLAGSPAIDIYTSVTCGTVADQRGITRPQGAGCDAGAVEVGSILLNGAADIYTEAGLVYIDAGARTDDGQFGNVPVVAVGVVDIYTVGSYVLTYDYTDSVTAIAATQVTRIVHVIDTIAPLVTAPESITVAATSTVGIDSTDAAVAAFLAGATAVDNAAVTSITHDAPETLPVGDTVVTFTAFDAVGNSNTANTIVIVTAFAGVAANNGSCLAPAFNIQFVVLLLLMMLFGHKKTPNVNKRR